MIKYTLPLLLIFNFAGAERPADVPQCQAVTRTICPGERVVVVKKPKPKPKPVQVTKCDAPTKETIVYVERQVIKTKKNIISLYAQRKIVSVHTSTSTNSIRLESQSSLVPGLQYQRLFDSGAVLGVGIDTQAELIGSVGFGF